MLHSFTVSNFLSFPYSKDLKTTGYSNEPINPTISFEKTNYSHIHPESIFKKHGLLKTLALVGPCYSGKTNLLYAFDCLQSIVIHGRVKSEDYKPNMYSTNGVIEKNNECRFTIVFSKMNIKYVYSLGYIDTHITSESLYYFPNGRPVRVFNRDDESTEGQREEQIGPHFRNKEAFSFDYHKLIHEDCLYLVAFYKKSNESTPNPHTPVLNAYNFIVNDLVLFISTSLGKNEEFRKYLNKLETDRNLKQKYKETLPYFGLENVSTVKFDLNSNNSHDRIHVGITYNGIQEFHESKSVLRTLKLAVVLKYIFDKKRILILDSDIRLSDIITIEKLFRSEKINNASQLLFTTDSPCFLDLKTLRKDQIYLLALAKDHHYSRIQRLVKIHLNRNDKLQALFSTNELLNRLMV